MKRYHRWQWLLAGFAFAMTLLIACTGMSQNESVDGAASDCGSPTSGPTDNPIATHYGKDAPAWTDDIRLKASYRYVGELMGAATRL
jgi:hypothetical protein